jgi:hypothetical protein
MCGRENLMKTLDSGVLLKYYFVNEKGSDEE